MKVNIAILVSALLLFPARGSRDAWVAGQEEQASDEADKVVPLIANKRSLRGSNDRRLISYFSDHCYISGGDLLCKDFCGPGRHFWYDTTWDDCRMSESETLRWKKIPDCKHITYTKCDMKGDATYYDAQKRICNNHCTKGIAAVGMQNCEKITGSGWWCKYWKEPYLEGIDSHMHYMCTELPKYEPTAGTSNCTCRLDMAKSTDEYDASRTCRECSIVDDENNNPHDGRWVVDYDCHNVNRSGENKICSGLPKSCKGLCAACLSVDGCRAEWTGSGGRPGFYACVGTPRDCSEFSDKSSCENQGCTWN